jgi:hypothetical protein
LELRNPGQRILPTLESIKDTTMNKTDFHKIIAESQNRERDFFKNEYSKYSFEQKVKYWLASIHQGMRTQKDVTGDEYSEFSNSWYLSTKKNEPEFDTIMKEVVLKLGFEFNWEEYKMRITASNN